MSGWLAQDCAEELAYRDCTAESSHIPDRSVDTHGFLCAGHRLSANYNGASYKSSVDGTDARERETPPCVLNAAWYWRKDRN